MREQVEEYVKWPCQHFPERLLSDQPDDAEDREKDNEAVGDIVEMADICRYLEKIGLAGSDCPIAGQYRRVQPLKKQDAE